MNQLKLETQSESEIKNNRKQDCDIQYTVDVFGYTSRMRRGSVEMDTA